MLRLPHWSALTAILIALSGIVVTIAIELVGTDELTQFGSVPDFVLIERSGRRVTRADLESRVWVADFIFTHCAGTCPMMTEQMRALQDVLPGSVRLVSFTVDPSRDTPTVLSAYADRQDADAERWLFLTGEREQLYRLAKEGFHLAVDDTIGTMVEPITHSSRFALVDRKGEIRGYYDGTAADSVGQLADDVRSLLAEVD